MNSKKNFEGTKRHYLAQSFKEEKISQFQGKYIDTSQF